LRALIPAGYDGFLVVLAGGSRRRPEGCWAAGVAVQQSARSELAQPAVISRVPEEASYEAAESLWERELEASLEEWSTSSH
jgi:hypothetical protein